jgi:hypothetical protein
VTITIGMVDRRGGVDWCRVAAVKQGGDALCEIDFPLEDVAEAQRAIDSATAAAKRHLELALATRRSS